MPFQIRLASERRSQNKGKGGRFGKRGIVISLVPTRDGGSGRH